MAVRMRVAAFGLLAGMALGACAPVQPAVRGFQAPGGAAVAAQLRVGDALTVGMLPGSAEYVGASSDGSLIGFLTPDGYIRWYKTH